jgi:cytochrome c oxidase cbb3-type subunit 3/ubiquinol-cytochrome c reductase cytochrome c subunit
MAMLAVTSCDPPGRQAVETAAIRPADIADFRVLYSQNCSGCHGANGQGALTVGIGRRVYLAIADDGTIRKTIEEGRPGTPMQAFAQKAGGMLTDTQIDILVHGIRNWGNPGAFANTKLPAYAASEPGDATRGAEIFQASCAPCHGPEGRGARAIADSSYLALVSDQHLRTVIIVGMPNLGMPDRRSHQKPLTDTDVSDLVAWLAAQREPLSAQLKH